MAPKRTLTVNMSIEGLRETLAAFRQLPKDASAELRTRSLELSEMLATKGRAAARADGKQSALLATTIKARKDRVPSVAAGGTARVGRFHVPAYAVLFGSEFGMNRRSGWYARPQYAGSTGRQYRRHRGRQGYWFFPLVEENSREISKAWTKAADETIRKFAKGDV